MKLLMLASLLGALAGCTRGQSASAQTLRDGGGLIQPTITLDAGTRPLTRVPDAASFLAPTTNPPTSPIRH